jgi:hypothetical protein
MPLTPSPTVPEQPVRSRRTVLIAALGGAIVLATRRAPAPALAADPAPLRPGELRLLEAWYEALVPGAVRGGVGAYVAQQLRGDPRLALLQLRYQNWPGPWVDFYRRGLAGLEAASRARRHVAFAALPPEGVAALARSAAADRLPEWPAGPPPLAAWYGATRSDAIDVVYGTGSALERQGMGMTQNPPPPRW